MRNLGLTAGNLLTSATALVNGTSYYASQSTAGGCESVRTEVLVSITPNSDNVTTQSACATYTWANNGQTYATSGTYIGTTTNCVTEKLNLTINPNTDNVTTQSACATYTWANNGQTYTTSGTYTGTTTNCITEKLNLTITPNSDNVTTQSACASYTWANNGQTYTTSGTYTGTTTNCITDKLNLTITPNSDNVITIVQCGSYYTWANSGQTYSTSGTYTGTTTNCVTEKLNLTINSPSPNLTTLTSCDSYTWANNGQTYTTSGTYSDSTTNCVVQILLLTIIPSTDNMTMIASCDSYTWNGQTYTTSGTYTGTTANCVTEKLNLTINATPTLTGSNAQTLDVTSTLADIVVSPINVVWYASLANATSGTSPLANSTTVANATYYAVNTTNSCPSIPFAVTVSAVNLSNEDFALQNLIVYPNPTNGIVNIKNNRDISQVKVYNLLGQLIIDKKENTNNVVLDLSDLPSQLYTIKVLSDDGFEKTIKILKN